MKIEAPSFSMAINELTQKLIIRIDEGKFMDTQYLYTEINPTSSGVVQYKTQVQSLIVNGVYRDVMEIENKFPEIQQEFQQKVTTPVLDELIEMMQGEEQEVKPQIILR